MLDSSPSSLAYLTAFTTLVCAFTLSPVVAVFLFNQRRRALIDPPPICCARSYPARNTPSDARSFESAFCPAFSLDSVHLSDSDPADSAYDPFPYSDTSEYACVARATLACLRRIRPEADVAMEMTLVAELGLSDVQIARLTRSIFTATGREHQPGMFRKNIVTVEDLALYVIVSPHAQAALPPANNRTSLRKNRAA